MICTLILEDQTYAEKIDDRLGGMNAGSIKSRMHRLRHMLRQMAHRGEIEPPVASRSSSLHTWRVA